MSNPASLVLGAALASPPLQGVIGTLNLDAAQGVAPQATFVDQGTPNSSGDGGDGGEISISDELILTNVLRFVPKVVVARFAGDGAATPLSAPEFHTMEAAMVFFDISGFSSYASSLERDQNVSVLSANNKSFSATRRMSSALETPKNRRTSKTRRGSLEGAYSLSGALTNLSQSAGTGAEALTNCLNQILDKFIRAILKSGGDIIKFVGDGMIVMWQVTNETSMEAAVFHACQCAMENMASYDLLRSISNNSLGLHIGIGSGRVDGFHVGGALNRWEYILDGEALTRMNKSLDLSKDRQIIISKIAMKILKEVCAKHEVHCVCIGVSEDLFEMVSLEAPPTDILGPIQPKTIARDLNPHIFECLRSYVPGSVTSRLKSGLPSDHANLREVTVVFIELKDVNSQSSPEKLLEVFQTAVVGVQKAAYHVWATLRQVVVDDKGVVAIVVVGLPPFFHEDNGSSLRFV
jgi:class 3 adenylate cyclase